MADRWYYAHDQNKIGPFSGRQLRDLAVSGKILTTDTIWKDDIEQGVSATRVRYLFLPAPSDTSPASVPETPVPSSSATAVAELPVGKSTAEPIPAATAPDRPAAPELPDSIDLLPEADAPAAPQKPSAPQKKVKKGRAVAVKGVVIVSQDGVNAKYRKKCTVCGYEDSSWNTLKMASGMTRSVFFCPKCRKKREVEIQCFMQ